MNTTVQFPINTTSLHEIITTVIPESMPRWAKDVPPGTSFSGNTPTRSRQIFAIFAERFSSITITSGRGDDQSGQIVELGMAPHSHPFGEPREPRTMPRHLLTKSPYTVMNGTYYERRSRNSKVMDMPIDLEELYFEYAPSSFPASFYDLMGLCDVFRYFSRTYHDLNLFRMSLHSGGVYFWTRARITPEAAPPIKLAPRA